MSPVKPYQAIERSPMSDVARVAEPAPAPYAPVPPREPVATERTSAPPSQFSPSSQESEAPRAPAAEIRRAETPTPSEPAREQRTLDLPLAAPQSSPSASAANPRVASPTITPAAHVHEHRDSDESNGEDSGERKSDNAA